MKSLYTLKRHKNINGIQDFYIETKEDEDDKTYILCILIEFCSGGDMQGKINGHRKDKTLIDEHVIIDWLEQMASGLLFMHENGFIHRDLKPENIFFDSENTLRIGDFGLSVIVKNRLASDSVGTPFYMVSIHKKINFIVT